MFERIATGWELIQQSYRVLKLDKELLLFPVLSGIACLLVLASFAVPLWMTGALEEATRNRDNAFQSTLTYVVLFAFYFVNYFVIIFFNSALVGCAVIRLKGGNPTVGDGIGAAMARLPQIAGWALVSATVGMIIKGLEKNSKGIGRFLVGLFGMAWSIMTFFVIPVLVVEQKGPIAAIQRSIEVMRRTWGESLAAHFGIGLITFLLCLIGMVPIGLGVWALSSQLIVVGIALILVGILFVLAVSLVTSAMNSIIVAALYIYAAEGEVPSHFDSSLLRSAFGPKHT